MTKLEELLSAELREATSFLASALYGQWQTRRDDAAAFLRRAHDSQESIDVWTLGLPVHEFLGGGDYCLWVSPDGRHCDHGQEDNVHNLRLAACVPSGGR